MKTSPAFLLYYKDLFGDSKVRVMSKAERYDFIVLLAAQWEEGSIPKDMEALANMTDNRLEDWEKSWKRIGRCFEDGEEPETLQNARMKRQREEYLNLQAKRSQGGKTAQEKRKRGGDDPHEEDDEDPYGNDMGPDKTPPKSPGSTLGSSAGSTAGKTAGSSPGKSAGSSPGSSPPKTVGSSAGKSAGSTVGSSPPNSLGSSLGKSPGSSPPNSAGSTPPKTATPSLSLNPSLKSSLNSSLKNNPSPREEEDVRSPPASNAPPPPQAIELCEILMNQILQSDPKARVPSEWAFNRGWGAEARKILDRDQRPFQEAKELLYWATNHSFWRSNILSMGKFRSQYTQLLLQREEESTKRPATRSERNAAACRQFLEEDY